MLKEEAHRRHAAAGARLQRKEDHDELQTPIHCKVRLETDFVVIKIFLFFFNHNLFEIDHRYHGKCYQSICLCDKCSTNFPLI